MPEPQKTWGGSLHQTFRLLPEPSPNLSPFLNADGVHKDEVLKSLPYEAARARGGGTGAPDPRRYRDGKQVYQTAGLLYEDEDGYVRLTSIGVALRRWLPILNPKNSIILGRHAAYGLGAVQLVNPTGAGSKYDPHMRVFPFAFIWRAMLALESRISSDELNRAIFRVGNEDDLTAAIAAIGFARETGDLSAMGDETIADDRKNDRIIPWIAIASFGWTLIDDKDSGDGVSYRIPDRTRRLLFEASQLQHPHKEFATVDAYLQHIGRVAALPRDLR